jgi:hypothetical protein
VDRKSVLFQLLLESVQLEFDRYLAIYTFSILQQQFKLQDDWDQVLICVIFAYSLLVAP